MSIRDYGHRGRSRWRRGRADGASGATTGNDRFADTSGLRRRRWSLRSRHWQQRHGAPKRPQEARDRPGCLPERQLGQTLIDGRTRIADFELTAGAPGVVRRGPGHLPVQPTSRDIAALPCRSGDQHRPARPERLVAGDRFEVRQRTGPGGLMPLVQPLGSQVRSLHRRSAATMPFRTRPKTGTAYVVPWSTVTAPAWFEFNNQLEEALAAMGNRHLAYMVTRIGKSRSHKSGRQWLSQACTSAGRTSPKRARHPQAPRRRVPRDRREHRPAQSSSLARIRRRSGPLRPIR